jgi:hypothetical protein
VVITRLGPGFNTVVATGDENHIPIAGNWQVTARAICASP